MSHFELLCFLTFHLFAISEKKISVSMGDLKRKRGRKPKNEVSDSGDGAGISSKEALDDGVVSANPVENATSGDPQTHRRGRGRPRKGGKHEEEIGRDIAASPERRGHRFAEHNGDITTVLSGDLRHGAELAVAAAAAKVAPSMDAVVKVFCVHTEPNFSLPWQRKRQYSSSSSGFIIGGRRVLTNAHSVEHHTQVKVKKRGSDTKYLATVLSIGTECDIGMFHSF